MIIQMDSFLILIKFNYISSIICVLSSICKHINSILLNSALSTDDRAGAGVRSLSRPLNALSHALYKRVFLAY